MDNILSKVLLDEAKKKWHDLTQETTDPAKIVALSLCFEDALKLIRHLIYFSEKTVDGTDETRNESPTIQPIKSAPPVVTQVQTPMMSSFPACKSSTPISAANSPCLFYAVARGRKIGVFGTYRECRASVDRFFGAKFRKFDTYEEAMKFVEENRFHSSSNPSSNKRRSLPMEEISPKRPAIAAAGVPIVYTDGACSCNGRSKAKAGCGVYWGDDHPNNLSLPATGAPTNNRAEYEAALIAIKQARDKGHGRLIIRTDSMNLVSSMNEWIQKWKKNDWKNANGKAVANKDLIVAIDEMRTVVNVQFEHVNGHVGVHGNEMANQLAILGSKKFLVQRGLSGDS